MYLLEERKRKSKSLELRAETLNVGTMEGKSRELVDMMQRRKVDLSLCSGDQVER